MGKIIQKRFDNQPEFIRLVHIGVAKLTVNWPAPPIATQVIAENAVALRKGGELVVLLAAVRHARMNHNKRLSCASKLIADPCLARTGETRLYLHC